MSAVIAQSLAQADLGGWWIVVIVVAVVGLVFVAVAMQFMRLWLQAYFSNADVTFMHLIGMKLRKVDGDLQGGGPRRRAAYCRPDNPQDDR